MNLGLRCTAHQNPTSVAANMLVGLTTPEQTMAGSSAQDKLQDITADITGPSWMGTQNGCVSNKPCINPKRLLVAMWTGGICVKRPCGIRHQAIPIPVQTNKGAETSC